MIHFKSYFQRHRLVGTVALAFIASAGATTLRAEPVVYPAVYTVPVPPELTSAASSSLATTVDLAGDKLAVTYTLPLSLTGGQANRIELTGTLDAERGVFVMANDKVETAECRLNQASLVCTTKYVAEKLALGPVAAGINAAAMPTLTERAMRLKVAKMFVDEPRGVLTVQIAPE